MPAPTSLTITVRHRNQAWTTQRVGGQSGSNTMSSEAAVRRLADKLYPRMGEHRCELIAREGHLIETWRPAAPSCGSPCGPNEKGNRPA
jgi:hypothetical protein